MKFTKRTYRKLRDYKISEALGYQYADDTQALKETLIFLNLLAIRAQREKVWKYGVWRYGR